MRCCAACGERKRQQRRNSCCSQCEKSAVNRHSLDTFVGDVEEHICDGGSECVMHKSSQTTVPALFVIAGQRSQWALRVFDATLFFAQSLLASTQ